MFSHTFLAFPTFSLSKLSVPSSFDKVVTILAQEALAILLKSALSTLLTPMQPASIKYFYPTSSIPIDVKTTFTPVAKINSILFFKTSFSLKK